MKGTHTASQQSLIWTGGESKADVGTVVAGIFVYIQKNSNMKWPTCPPSSYSVFLLLLSLSTILNISVNYLLLSVPLQLQASTTLCLLGSTFPVIPYPQLYACWVVCSAYTSCWLPGLFHYSILERDANWSDSSFITRVWRHSFDRQILVRSTWNQHWRVSKWKDISKFPWHNSVYDASDGVIAGAKGWGGGVI